MNLPDEAVDAAVDAYMAHDDTIRVRSFSCDCGEQFMSATVGHVTAARLHMKHRMQAIADALAPYIRAQILREGGHQEWRVSGDPGQPYGFYNFVWPRPGRDETGEKEARAFYSLVTDDKHVPWVDGPHLHYRNVYTDTGPWLLAEESP